MNSRVRKGMEGSINSLGVFIGCIVHWVQTTEAEIHLNPDYLRFRQMSYRINIITPYLHIGPVNYKL